MINFIKKFKQLIRFMVSIIASREFAFIYCILGVIAQVAHTYYLTENISSLEGGWRVFQAILISVFISTSLLYFVAIADTSSENKKEQKRIFWAVNIFMIIEILINFYYYSRHLLIDSTEVKIFDFFFAVLVSCLIPVTIKLYAGLIKAKEWFEDIDDKLINSNIVQTPIITMDEIKSIVSEHIEDISKKFMENSDQVSNNGIKFDDPELNLKIEEAKNSMLETLNEDVLQLYQKNQELFLQQFRNKCKIISDEQLSTPTSLRPIGLEYIEDSDKTENTIPEK